MANLAKTQAQWTQIWKEFTHWIRLWRRHHEYFKKYSLSRITVWEEFETAKKLSKWTLSGLKRGVNSDVDGKLYVNITDETPGAGQARVQVYKDSARTQLVAQGDAADGATNTLAEQNSSGLTGTVKHGTVTASSSIIVLVTEIDEVLKTQHTFDTTDNFAQGSLTVYIALISAIASAHQGTRDSVKGQIDTSFLLTRLKSFMKSLQTVVVSSSESVDSNGDAVVSFPGILQDLKDNMEDELVGGAQTVLKNTVSAGSATFDADNVGVGSWATASTKENLRAGRLNFLCTDGKDTTLTELFKVTLIANDGTVINAPLKVTIKKAWESLYIGVRGTLSRTITDLNDGSNQVANYVVNGETLSNTDVGQLYQDLTNSGSTRTLKWYKSAAKAAGDLVAQGSRTGDGTVTMVAQNNSGLTGSADVTYTGDDTDMVVKLNPFKKDDAFYIDLTNDEAGLIQTAIRDIWGVYMPSSASPTIVDDLLEEGEEVIRIEES